MQPDAATIVDVRRRTGLEDYRVLADITDETMSPRYEIGERVVFNKSLRPVIGDEVLIVRKSDGGCLVRRLVGFDGTSLRLLQHNPQLEAELPVDEVSELYPCVTYEPPLCDRPD